MIVQYKHEDTSESAAYVLTHHVVVRRWLLAPSDPAYRLRWFAQQKAIMHSFANPHPGRPGILDKPIFAWWYLIQGYV